MTRSMLIKLISRINKAHDEFMAAIVGKISRKNTTKMYNLQYNMLVIMNLEFVEKKGGTDCMA